MALLCLASIAAPWLAAHFCSSDETENEDAGMVVVDFSFYLFPPGFSSLYGHYKPNGQFMICLTSPVPVSYSDADSYVTFNLIEPKQDLTGM